MTFENPDDDGKLTVTDGNGFACDAVCNPARGHKAFLLADGLLNDNKESGLND